MTAESILIRVVFIIRIFKCFFSIKEIEARSSYVRKVASII